MNKCFVTVRSASTRLQQKCFLKFGKYTLIDHVIMRAKKYKLEPIICTSNRIRDRVFKKIAKNHQIKIYFGSEKNKLKRWYDCAKKFNIKQFHTIDADDPYFDDKNIIKSIKMLKKYDIVKPSKNSRRGSATEGYSFRTNKLEKLLIKNDLLNNSINTEMIDSLINKSRLKLGQLPDATYITKKPVRLTLDYIEDYELMNILFKIFGSFEKRMNINSFLDKYSSLRKINYFRNQEWKKRQNSIIKSQL